jgi:hypothetical protein
MLIPIPKLFGLGMLPQNQGFAIAEMLIRKRLKACLLAKELQG